MNDETYEGWSNRQTWLVNLEIDNDYGLYLKKQNFLMTSVITDESVKMFVESVSCNLDNINWKELAESFMSEQKYIFPDKWIPSPLGDIYENGERWSLMRHNPRAGYYQEAGRVVKYDIGWAPRYAGDERVKFPTFDTPQEAAKELLRYV